MSTTGWRVGMDDVAADPFQRRCRLSGSRGCSASPSSTKQRTLSSMAARCPCSSLEQVRLSGNVHAFAQLQRRLLRGGPVAPRAGDDETLVLRDRQRRAGELSATASGSHATSSPRSAASVATAQVYEAVWR